MRHAIANANINSDGDGNGNGGCVSYANVYAYSDSYAYCYSNGFDNAYPHLRAGNLYDNYYHWHDNPGRHRYWQPLRRLHHAGHAAIPGKRIRPCGGYIDFSRL